MKNTDLMKGYILGRYRYNKTKGEVIDLSLSRPVGSINDRGYLVMSVSVPHQQTRLLKVHNVVWLLYHGDWPREGLFVDHKDRDKLNNKIANLRLVSKRLNNMNRSLSGDFCPYTVVSWKKAFKRWAVFIGEDAPDVFTKRGYQGMYDTDLEAIEAVRLLLKETDKIDDL